MMVYFAYEQKQGKVHSRQPSQGHDHDVRPQHED